MYLLNLGSHLILQKLLAIFSWHTIPKHDNFLETITPKTFFFYIFIIIIVVVGVTIFLRLFFVKFPRKKHISMFPKWTWCKIEPFGGHGPCENRYENPAKSQFYANISIWKREKIKILKAVKLTWRFFVYERRVNIRLMYAKKNCWSIPYLMPYMPKTFFGQQTFYGCINMR